MNICNFINMICLSFFKICLQQYDYDCGFCMMEHFHIFGTFSADDKGYMGTHMLGKQLVLRGVHIQIIQILVMWGYLINQVYHTKVLNLEHLFELITTTANKICGNNRTEEHLNQYDEPRLALKSMLKIQNNFCIKKCIICYKLYYLFSHRLMDFYYISF